MPKAADPHAKYERSQVSWLLFSYGIIALMTLGILFYGALQSGLIRPRAESEPPWRVQSP